VSIAGILPGALVGGLL